MTRRFHLERDVDVSGVSGTGVVADGCVFPDGTAVVRWRGERQSTVVWPSIEDVEAIHGPRRRHPDRLGRLMTQTFWLEPTDQVAVGLRRYTNGDGGFDCAHGHHHALVYTGTEPAEYDERDGRKVRTNGTTDVDHSDPRWPHTCAQLCGYEFTDDDHWQRWTELLYRRTDTDELRVLHQGAPAPEAPSAEPGATWDAWWMPFSRGDDGIYLMVRCPDGHDWSVDSRASNCGLPDDDVHKCWVRHGDPRECHVTVDKNGVTCNAGAGSIQTPNWHGFLRNGELVS